MIDFQSSEQLSIAVMKVNVIVVTNNATFRHKLELYFVSVISSKLFIPSFCVLQSLSEHKIKVNVELYIDRNIYILQNQKSLTVH